MSGSPAGGVHGEIGRAVQQECRDRYRMPSSACKKTAEPLARSDLGRSAMLRRATRTPPPVSPGPVCAGCTRGGRECSRSWMVGAGRLFFFNDAAPPEIYTLSLPGALPI